jgi:acyl-coenzyme A thioesterase PaaI-like protein
MAARDAELRDAELRDAELGEPLAVPWAALPDYQCFGCSPQNANGLQLRFWSHPDGLQTVFRAGRRFESYPGVVHGGLVSTVCDETMGNLLVLRDGRSAFTVALRMRYIEPLAVDVEYRCVARKRTNQPDPELFHAAAEVLAPDGAQMATATATYQPVSMERARRHLVLSDDEARVLEHAMAQLDPTGADQHRPNGATR